MGVHRFTELRAWPVCNTYKRAIYRLCAAGGLSRDLTGETSSNDQPRGRVRICRKGLVDSARQISRATA